MIFEYILLIISTLQVGLSTGLCFTFFNSINPSFAKLDEKNYIKTMQLINHEILNPLFLFIFIGPLITLTITTVLFRNENINSLLLIASGIYILGLIGITITKNVPLNNKLKKINIKNIESREFQKTFKWYREPWNFWHNIRSLASLISFILLLIILLIV